MNQQSPAGAAAGRQITEETKLSLMMRVAALFKRPKKAPFERNPLTPEERVLITNLSAMR